MKYTRAEAMQLVAGLGGVNETGVTKRTHLLIVAGNELSNKKKRAEKYREDGQDITLVPESVFYDMLGDAGYGQTIIDGWLA